MAEAHFIRHEPCPGCGSQDNLARYSDGSAYCFGCKRVEKSTDKKRDNMIEPTVNRRGSKGDGLVQDAHYTEIPARSLSLEACQTLGYRVGTYKGIDEAYRGEVCHVADYYSKDGVLVAQKLRFKDKNFKFVGEPKKVTLFGQNHWRNGGRRIVITEGEIDAVSVCQALGNKWPVVSVPNGASGAAASIKKNLEYLEAFEEVVLYLDDDEDGQAAVEECVELFSTGKVKVAKVPGYKDANEALSAGAVDKIVEAIWNAKSYRPDGIETFDEFLKGDIEDPQVGLPWFSERLTKMTLGRRYGEIYTFGAGTGIGKTDFLLEQACYDSSVLRQPIGLFFLEHDNTHDIFPRLVGKFAGKRYHLPADVGQWTDDEYRADREKLVGCKVFSYRSSGSRDWDVVKRYIRFLRHSEGVRIITLDNLTALTSGNGGKDKDEVDFLMKDLQKLCQELGIICMLVSHLTTPEGGKSHEEGLRVQSNQFRGSRAIQFWSHYMFGLERNTQADSEAEKLQTTVRVLKARWDGSQVGKTISFMYDVSTGRLQETLKTAESYGF